MGFIVTYPLNQLGNCLRNVLSSLILSIHTKRDLEINLKRTRPECAEVLKKLFPGKWTYKDRQRLSVPLRNGKNTNFNLINEGRIGLKECEAFEVRDSIYSFLPRGMDDQEFIQQKIGLYKSLLKSFNFVAPEGISSWIGVHIRYGDNLREKSKRHLNTSLKEFKKKINAQTAPILLCTDNQMVRNTFPSSIKPQVLYTGATQALYEMWLLSQCSKIIGSTSSTFSYESAFFKGSEIHLFEAGEWVTYNLESAICLK